MKQYKAILFDLDGTLLDTSEGVISSVQYTIDTLGYEKLDLEQMRSFIGPPVHRRLREIYGISEEESLRAMNIFRSHYGGDDLLKAHAYEGMKDLLLYLHEKGYQLGVATYKREDMAKRVLEHCGIASCFDSIHGSDAAGKYSKADVVRNCIHALGVDDPADAVLVGDSDNDAVGAHEIGLGFVGVTYGFGFSSKEDVLAFEPDAVAADVAQLKELF